MGHIKPEKIDLKFFFNSSKTVTRKIFYILIFCYVCIHYRILTAPGVFNMQFNCTGRPTKNTLTHYTTNLLYFLL